MLLSSSPHVFANVDVRKIMLAVILALAPATAYGVLLYGIPAVVVIVSSIAAAVLGEFLFDLAIGKKPRIGDLSAVLTGLLLALILPVSTSWWMAALGGIFATVFAKEFFGGIGANPFNPALVGRAILLMSFPAAITTWHKPFGPIVDATTTATPLNVLKLGGTLQDVAASVGATDIGSLYLKLFIGARSGCIGESSIMLILLGGALLLALGVIQWITPVAMMASAVLVSWLLGTDPVFAFLSGGLAFGAIFMATDYSTSPITPAGKALFGAGAGVITALIRKFGGFPEGVTYGILIMNSVAPYMDKLRVPRYGKVRPPEPAAAKEAVK
ncbi:MAG: RnfABCDGE type electron transport complex subunit D [Spirochaetes bacterium]|nr:RnfABCDGE type electron transport complex subunit D [Spirochaetota bacterium]